MADDTPQATKRPSRAALFVAGLLVGLLVLLGVRFITYSDNAVHYHANFAVYINGQREQFKDPQYYEEVKLCSLGGTSPQSRAHMHNQENSVVHVHDAAVTWGQFFDNLGWNVGPDFIRSRTTLYTADDTNKLHIVLNGQDLTDVTVITNQVIGDKDRLLVSYGSVTIPELQTEYKAVTASAATYDTKPDPASCAGHDAPGFGDRLKHLL